MERKCFCIKLPRTDVMHTILAIVFTIAYIVVAAFESQNHVDNIKMNVNAYFSFGHYTDIITASFPAISNLCLLIKRNKLSKVAQDIININESSGMQGTSCNSKKWHCVFVLVLLLEYLYELGNEGFIMLLTPSDYTFYPSIFLIWLVLRQFADRFSILRFYYGQLLDLLNIPWVDKEKLVKYHEVLGCCSTTLWECYALQMTIFVVFSFVLSVSYLYLVIDSYLRSGTLTAYHYVYLFWPIMYCFFIWLIVYSCAETKNMAKKFDKKLSQLIMNDVTNKLINNKRIMHHYKVKFKDFSAMGFFNFDYPLLFSMVSTATTYIVILVQFSGRDDSQ
ncbi:unnamed protein product [Nezara viridula]|uniref:Gustatory receptor n=1 Tax=Nezara viridula TaxID=85310 RepID=A0A9P0EHZ1_NEZVI|nr:unnamed protein product [Nezara viridula]